MEQERIWILFARKVSGEASAQELLELETLLRENPEMVYYLQMITSYWNAEPQQAGEEPEKVLGRILTRIEKDEKGQVVQEEKQKIRPPLEIAPQKNSIIYPFVKGANRLIDHLKFTWRILFRNKAFSFVNITGLSIGMASAVVLLLIIQAELSVDQFHKNKDRTYLLYNRAVIDGKIQCWESTPMVMGPVIKMNYPEVEEVTRTNWVAAFILKNGDKHIQTEGMLTDPGFLTMFSFPLLKGNARTALSSPRGIVITETLQKKLFGNEDAFGKTIRIDSNAYFTVTGVMKKLPVNTRFSFEYLVPWSYMKELGWDNPKWSENSIARTYVVLKPGISEATANNRFRNIIKSHTSEVKNEVFVHPMKKWHLYSRFENGKVAGGNIEDVRMFGIIAAFILLIACINYMNLSTARSVKRAKEVGIRKVAGAGKRSLISQFLVESIFFSCLSAAMALVILGPGLSWFNNRFNSQLSIPFGDPDFWIYAVGFILLTGILAGIYPAFYLSSYQPIRVLKGLFKGTRALVTPRKVLVVIQFTFAITLIISTLVIYQQFVYGKKRDTGYEQKNLVYAYMKGSMREKYQPIRTALLNTGAITAITQTNSAITDVWIWEDNYTWENKKEGERYDFMKYQADQGFVNTIGLKLIAGRDIDVYRYPSDSNAMLINQSAARLMGFKNPVGQFVRSPKGNYQIVGVVNDFISLGPFQPVFPVAVEGPDRPDYSGTITFRLNDKHPTAANLEKIKAVFKEFNPDYPFEYHFVEETYKWRFGNVKSFGTLAALFAALTILISCLGLFALATYMAENRIKEIGVRKVLGASVMRITALLSRDFLKLVFMSFVIASPLAWWLMNAWLSDYPYRVSIGWWVFVLTGSLSILIALITISYQALKSAMANPVRSLRTE